MFDSELKLMEILWANEPISAKELCRKATEEIGWNKNTTYTIIKKLIEKKMIHREEPNFICTALKKKEDVRRTETNALIDKLFKGSKQAFIAMFLNDEDLSEKEIKQIREMIERQ